MQSIKTFFVVFFGMLAALFASPYILPHLGQDHFTALLIRHEFLPDELTYKPQALPDNGTRAVDNRNPLNIKFYVNNPWEGQIGFDAQGHAVFASYEYGMRAAALTLRAYKLKYGIDTVEGIIARFAEGNRKQYVNFICKRLDVKPDESIDIIKRMPDLLRAMFRFESGQEAPEELIAPYTILEKI